MVAPVTGDNASGSAPKKGGTPKWVVILLVCVAAAPVLLGVFSAIAIYGVRKYITNAKRAEAQHVLSQVAKNIEGCAESTDESGKPRGLPESAPPIPADLAAVAGKKYQSAASDWSAPAYACSGFVLLDPQYFQYEYRRVDATHGEVIAVADLDADGVADERNSIAIDCASDGSTCSVGLVTQ